jgi:hypothetical protein
MNWIELNYCHALSDYRRVLDWQSDLLHFTTKYNWVSPDSLGLTIHDRIYQDNSAATVSTATALLASFPNTILVAAELQVPFLPFLATNSTDSLTNYLSEIYDLWTDGREDTFSERRPFLGTDSKETSISRFQVTSLLASEASHSVHVTLLLLLLLFMVLLDPNNVCWIPTHTHLTFNKQLQNVSIRTYDKTQETFLPIIFKRLQF